ncbi:hypothetical protein BaRGS_00017652 [Batillaria attramentaria]|uniref:Fibrinogen C-terminal domain-containing protein n=1 Tax=Batillaria attramentaria TaxID=370345 RepID=A0ABD0KVZ7_9CAEN
MANCLTVVWIVGSFAAAAGMQWTTPAFLVNGSTVRACEEDTVTFHWNFSTDPAEHLVDVEWYFHTPGDSGVIIATFVAGNFFETPSSSQKLDFLPHAGIRLSNVSEPDFGTYSVHVNLELHGSIMKHVQETPLGSQVNSTSFTSGRFLLNLPNPVTQGNYSCQLQLPYVTSICGRLNSSLLGQATVKVDDLDVELAVLKARLEAVEQENARLSARLEVLEQRNPDTDGWGWLGGLKDIYTLTSSDQCTVRVDLADWNGNTAYAKYTTFYTDGPDKNYVLHVGGYSGTAGDSFSFQNNSPFSTVDRDNNHNSRDCGVESSSGWWHSNCARSDLNGPYSTADDTWAWFAWADWLKFQALKGCDMKIQPKN